MTLSCIACCKMFVDPVSDKSKCGKRIKANVCFCTRLDSVIAKTFLVCIKPEFQQQNLCEGVQVLCSDLRIKDMLWIFLLERQHFIKEVTVFFLLRDNSRLAMSTKTIRHKLKRDTHKTRVMIFDLQRNFPVVLLRKYQSWIIFQTVTLLLFRTKIPYGYC